MVIEKYNLILKEVEEEDLEMIRQYRNADTIRNKMLYRKLISKEEQIHWFQTIQTAEHYYFIIYQDGNAIGLINGKNIDYVAKSSEGGIFIWDQAVDVKTPIIASIILNDWNFFINDFKVNYAQVLKSNKQAIAYNTFMGYKYSNREHENPEAIWMLQSKDDYVQNREKMLDRFDFKELDLNEMLQEEDIRFQDHEKVLVRKLIESLPLGHQELYTRILNR